LKNAYIYQLKSSLKETEASTGYL